MPREIITI